MDCPLSFTNTCWLITSLKFPLVSLLEKEISGETGEVDDGVLSIVNHITASKKGWRDMSLQEPYAVLGALPA